ncbi:MAG: DUF1553 domain-containing protein [Lentisphaeria bacterium]|nr:DUF1553 domain-containing protein [Lentisphaeria bacterium]
MRCFVFIILSLTFLPYGQAKTRSPYNKHRYSISATDLDRVVEKSLKKQSFKLVSSTSDPVFVRRIYLDLIGRMPTVVELNTFLNSKERDKREALITHLLNSERYTTYWTMRWCDILRVKSEFPINLWPNGVQTYYHWIRAFVHSNKPYNQFATELITASGSNFRVPAVNFFQAIQGESVEQVTSAILLTFMGIRYKRLSPEIQQTFKQFFSYLKRKNTAEWKEKIVFSSPEPRSDLTGIFPGGFPYTVKQTEDPRKIFSQWLTHPKNEFFAKALVNRIWFWLMGRGIIQPADDMYPCLFNSSPQVMKYLETEFIQSGYDVKKLIHLIVSSKVYQQDSTAARNPKQKKTLAFTYKIRPIEAEVLTDMLGALFGNQELYKSVIPEPFTFLPRELQTIAIQDGSITSSFLQIFNRPERDTGFLSERSNLPSKSQRVYMLNSDKIQSSILRSNKLKQILSKSRRGKDSYTTGVYKLILSRAPTSYEVNIMNRYRNGSKRSKTDAAADLMWALLNTKEFLYKH